MSTSALYQRAPSLCDNIENCRTTWGIIWSCLVTIFSCTWVAIHPNIPGPDEGSIKIGLRRAGIMIMALLSPELVVAWAARQWLISRRLAQQHRKRGWTQTHGFFALMGGFMLRDGEQAPRTLLPEELDALVQEGKIYFPRITEKEIQDKSKGDMLSKGFVVVQTTWFALQCIARGAQRLPATELEIATLAFTALTVTTYGLWWNKPLDIDCAYQVHTNPCNYTGAKGDGEQLDHETDLESDIEPENDMRDASSLGLLTSSIAIIDLVALRMWKRIKDAINDEIESIKNYVNSNTAGDITLDVTLRPLFRFVEMGGTGSDVMQPGSQRVPSFYAGKLTATETALLVYIVPTIAATIFGAIHCIAWSFDFPSRTEQMLWRICALAIISAPTLMGVSCVVDDKVLWIDNLIDVLYIGLGILYILSRIALLVLAFTSMRSLPPGAYQSVSWINFIPHV